MGNRHLKIKHTEVILVTFVWLVLLVTPVLFRDDSFNSLWKSMDKEAATLLPLFIVFLINRFILVPRLLFKGRHILFITSVLGITILFTLGSFIYDTQIKRPPRAGLNTGNETRNVPPEEFMEGGPDRNGTGFRPPSDPQPRPIPPFANFLILAVLVVGFDTGLRSSLRVLEVENEKVQLEKENVATQLLMLRNQVSPHFFMNTLNNIHELIDINTEDAKDAIVRLSTLMRYLLYHAAPGSIELKKEIEFISSYVSLMKLRFSDEVEIMVVVPDEIPNVQIPPMIFISFLENAFKHGIHYPEKSFVYFELQIRGSSLWCMVKNSKHKTLSNQNDIYSGIGLENIRKSLQLLYGESYQLTITDTDTQFEVDLTIPL